MTVESLLKVIQKGTDVILKDMYRNMGGTLLEFSRVTYDEIPQLIVQTIAGNYRIVFAYLAGKALGVDLVKVVEG